MGQRYTHQRRIPNRSLNHRGNTYQTNTETTSKPQGALQESTETYKIHTGLEMPSRNEMGGWSPSQAFRIVGIEEKVASVSGSAF